MWLIITKNKRYIWNYKRFLRNLFHLGALIYFIVAYLYVSNMEYLSLFGR